MISEKNKFFNIPFVKPKSDTTAIEFQIIDMKTLFEIKPEHNLEYPHKLDFNLIIIVKEAEGTHTIDFESYAYKKGTVFFIKKNQVHSFNLNPELDCYLLQFTDNFFNRLSQNNVCDIFDYMRYPSCLQLDKDSLEDILNNINLINNQLNVEVDEYKESILQSLLQSVLLQLKRKRENQVINLRDKDQRLYQDFLNMVHTLHTYTMKVEDYALNLDISTRTLANLLNKYTGKPTKVYLNEFLILEIKRYLLDESLTIQEISDKLNFDEATNLVKLFKKYENVTPSEFKRLAIN